MVPTWRKKYNFGKGGGGNDFGGYIYPCDTPELSHIAYM